MDSNEHFTMEQNEEHLEANISIYYPNETELWSRSYDAMNRATYCKYYGTSRKSEGGKKSSSSRSDLARAEAGLLLAGEGGEEGGRPELRGRARPADVGVGEEEHGGGRRPERRARGRGRRWRPERRAAADGGLGRRRQ